VAANLELDRVRRTRDRLRESQDLIDQAQRLARVGSWELELATGAISGSDELARIVNLTAEELASGGLEGPDTAAGPDGFTYLLRLEQEGAAREVHWTDGTLPPDLATVVASLVRLARPSSAGR
jgi:hypothetical protein